MKKRALTDKSLKTKMKGGYRAEQNKYFFGGGRTKVGGLKSKMEGTFPRESIVVLLYLIRLGSLLPLELRIMS